MQHRQKAIAAVG